MTDPAPSDVTYVCGGCGAHLPGLGLAHSCAAEIVALRAERDRLAEALRDIEAWVGPGFVKNRARAALSGEEER